MCARARACVCVCVCVCARARARARAILAILVSQNWVKVVRGTTPTPNSSEREGAAGIGSVGDGIGEGGTPLCGSLAYISTKKRPTSQHAATGGLDMHALIHSSINPSIHSCTPPGQEGLGYPLAQQQRAHKRKSTRKTSTHTNARAHARPNTHTKAREDARTRKTKQENKPKQGRQNKRTSETSAGAEEVPHHNRGRVEKNGLEEWRPAGAVGRVHELVRPCTSFR